MNAYRQQQLAAAALIEQGADAEQIAEVFGWTARAAPERSGTARQQTGDKNALTALRKCGIIKAIKRHFRRWERKKEGKAMKIYEITISWKTNNGAQIAYAYCAADSKNAAKRKIREKIPYHIEKINPEDFGVIQDANSIPKKAAEIGDGVSVWYFDKDKKEHKEKF